MVRKIQIGVMGSAADLGYSEAVARLAEEIGREVALAGCTLVFGAEKDCDSLSSAAGRGARSVGGLTVGVTYGKGLAVYDDADVIIAISGGSGTLTEMVVAYQASIPVIGLCGCGGWSEKLAGTAFDARRPYLAVKPAATAKQAVELALAAFRDGGEDVKRS